MAQKVIYDKKEINIEQNYAICDIELNKHVAESEIAS